jgi:hypothetical protein
MKKADEIRKEYTREDLGRGVRGKYYREYMKGTNLVLLRPEIAKAFPTSDAVNEALQSLINVANRTANLTSIWPRLVKGRSKTGQRRRR